MGASVASWQESGAQGVAVAHSLQKHAVFADGLSMACRTRPARVGPHLLWQAVALALCRQQLSRCLDCLGDFLLMNAAPSIMGEELQPNMVRPQLYLASVRTEVYMDILDQNGITHILQVCPWPADQLDSLSAECLYSSQHCSTDVDAAGG